MAEETTRTLSDDEILTSSTDETLGRANSDLDIGDGDSDGTDDADSTDTSDTDESDT